MLRPDRGQSARRNKPEGGLKWKIRNLLFLTGLLIVTCAGFAQDREALHFVDTGLAWKDILALSAKEKKPVFLDCYTSWCGPCKEMALHVFTQQKVGDFMNAHFINVSRDMEKGEGIQLARQYKNYIPGFPTFLLIDAEGKVKSQSSGSMPAEEFVRTIQDGLDGRSWVALSSRYEAGERNWSFLLDYLSALGKSYQQRRQWKLIAENNSRLSLDEIEKDSAAYRYFKTYWDDTQAPLFRSFLVQDVKISYQHKDTEKELEEWEGRAFTATTDRYYDMLRNKPDSYNIKGADSLIRDLYISHAKNREDMIAAMRINNAVFSGDNALLFSLLDGVHDFGLLRYSDYHIGDWIKRAMSRTKDPQQLNASLKYVDYLVAAPYSGTSPLLLKADILSRMGRTDEAKACKDQAAAKEAASKALLEKKNNGS